jgi:hypothetical protein
MKCVVVRGVDEGEKVAADAVHLGLYDAHDGICGDRSVHRVAAALEHLHASLGCERLTRRDDAGLGCYS